jgi:FkbM family methyltransferase
MIFFKSLLKQIINKLFIKKIIVFLLRKKLISRRFKNLIKLNGFHNIYESNIKILNNKNDSVSRDLCIFGIPNKEYEVFSKFLSEIKKINSFLDIGAGIGLYTLFAINNNQSIKTLSIEPNPEVFKVLEKNLNSISPLNTNNKTLNKAVSNEKRSLEFYIPTGDDFSYGTSNKNLLEEKDISYKSLIVETSDLKEFSNDFYEIIKIDVEGSELEVLMAIKEQLSHCKFLFIEILGINKNKAISFLDNYGLKPIVESVEEVGNFIFQRQDSE